MTKSRLVLTGVLFLLGTAAGLGGAESASFPFFALDNGVGRGEWTPEQQARTVKELGYDGIGYNYVAGRPDLVQEWRRQLEQRGLKLFSLYIYTFPDKPGGARYQAGLREAILALKGSDAMVWMTLREAADKRKTGLDETCVEMVREVAGWAAEAGVKVALYGHAGFYVATAEEALRIAKQTDRANVGVTVNLCHELMQNNGDRLEEIVRLTASRLLLVTVNGADEGGKPGGYIQRLDQGNFDVLGFLQALRRVGFKGPVGLQSYSVKGDVRENLELSKRAWDRYMGGVLKPGKTG